MDGLQFLCKLSFSDNPLSCIRIRTITRSVFILGLLCITMFGSTRGNSCDVVPLSASDIKSCQDGICTTKQTGNWVLPLFPGSSICLTAPPLGTQDITLHFNISVLSAFNSYGVEYCYFADDPVFDIQGLCGCYGGTTATCPSCAGDTLYPNNTLCLSGYHDGQGCFLHATGTYCLKIGFNALQRYKICKINQKKSSDIVLAYFDTNKTLPIIYKEGQYGTLDEDHVKVTIYDAKPKVDFQPDFYLIDLFDPSNFYLLSADHVNGRNDFNPKKVGWFKYNRTVPHSIVESISSRIVSCSANEFTISTNWVNTADWLGNHPEYLSGKKYPGSSIQDPVIKYDEFDSRTTPNHDWNDGILSEGGLFLSPPNGAGVIMLGITKDFDILPTPVDRQVYPGNLTIWGGGFLNGQWFCCGFVPTYNFPNGSYYSIEVCQSIVSPSTWGVAVLFEGILYTVNTRFIAYEWPSGSAYWYSFNGSFIKTEMFEADTILGQESVYLPIREGNMYGTVEFLNYHIQFDTFTIRPQIGDIEQRGDTVALQIRSTSTSGTCVLSFDPNDVISAMTVELTLIYNEYRVPIMKNTYKGYINAIVTCYKYVDKQKFWIEIIRESKDDYDLVDVAESKPSTVKSVWEDVKDWFKDAYRSLSRWAGNIWTSWILNVVFTILALVLIGYLIKTLWLLFKTRGWKIWRKPNPYHNLQEYLKKGK